MVTLNPQEVDEMKDLIAAGKLPASAIKDHLKNEETRVFGVNPKRDRKGRPIEDGIGSKGNETTNHFDAMAERERRGLEKPGTTQKLRDEWLAKKAKEAEDE